MQVLLSFVTTIIAAVVTYLSATDKDQDTSAASGAQARDSAEKAILNIQFFLSSQQELQLQHTELEKYSALGTSALHFPAPFLQSMKTRVSLAPLPVGRFRGAAWRLLFARPRTLHCQHRVARR